MATKVTLPLLGQTMEEGTIVKWFKNEGEAIQKEEPLLEVMTDKANMEVESPESGTLLKIVAQPDETVPVKGLIAIIGKPGEDISALLVSEGQASPTAASASPPPPADSPASSGVTDAKPPVGSGRITASPRARKLAEENGIDLSLMTGKGSGPGGRIIEKDVLGLIASAAQAIGQPPVTPPATPLAQKAAADRGIDLTGVAGSGPGGKVRMDDIESAQVTPSPIYGPKVGLGKIIPFTGLRKAIADNLEKSARSVIPVTLTVSVDMTEAGRLREQVKPLYEQRYGVKLGYTDIIVKAAARAIEDFPIINSSLEANQIRIHDNVNISVAVAVDDGLVAPSVKDANLKPLWTISAEIRDLAERARANKLTPNEFTGGTFTITNLGAYGIENFNAIINPPQSAILAVCAIKEQTVVIDKQVKIRPMMNLCLTFDHRVMDGVPASRYVVRVKELLEQPYLILA